MAFINKVDSANGIGNVLNNKNKADGSFEDLLKQEIDNTNNMMQKAEKAEADIATISLQEKWKIWQKRLLQSKKRKCR